MSKTTPSSCGQNWKLCTKSWISRIAIFKWSLACFSERSMVARWGARQLKSRPLSGHWQCCLKGAWTQLQKFTEKSCPCSKQTAKWKGSWQNLPLTWLSLQMMQRHFTTHAAKWHIWICMCGDILHKKMCPQFSKWHLRCTCCSTWLRIVGPWTPGWPGASGPAHGTKLCSWNTTFDGWS